MSTLAYRRSVVFRDRGSADAGFASAYTVTAYMPGGVVAADHTGSTPTVEDGHGFVGGEKYVVFGNEAKFGTVSSVSSNTLTLGASETLLKGEVLINLGSAESGSTEPAYDGSPVSIYSENDDSSTPYSQARLTVGSEGQFEYWTAQKLIWELVRDGSGVMAEIVKNVEIARETEAVGRYHVDDYGAIGDNTTDDTTAIQSAANAAAALTNGTGVVEFSRGKTYRVTSALTFKSNVLGHGATISYDASDGAEAVTLGDIAAQITNLRCEMPYIVKAAMDWDSADSDTTGLRIVNLVRSELHVYSVNNFTTGILRDSTGVITSSSNNIHLTSIGEAKFGIKIVAAAGSATNQDQWIGGRVWNVVAALPADGVKLTVGTGVGSVNAHTFFGTDLEGNLTAGGKNILCESSNRNLFLCCRFEGTNRLITFDGSVENQIVGGTGLEETYIEEVNSAGRNSLFVPLGNFITAGQSGTAALALTNASGAGDPHLVLFNIASPGGDPYDLDPLTDYAALFTANKSSYKSPTATDPEVSIDHTSGTIGFGSGTAAEDSFIKRGNGGLGIKVIRKLDIDSDNAGSDPLLRMRRNDALEATILTQAADHMEFLDASNSQMFTMNAGVFQMDQEISAPTGTADKAKLYLVDNGGKTELRVIFGTGASVLLATEP